MEGQSGRPRKGEILKLLIANPGSSSRRYALFQDGTVIASAHLERKGEVYQAFFGKPTPKDPVPISEQTFLLGPEYFLEESLKSGALRVASEITGTALRVVAPGTFFQKHGPMDGRYLKELEKAADLAPLHAEPALKEAEILRRMFPNAPLLGISDSAFHATLPPVAREYALPAGDAKRWDIHRFGYHGISAQSVLRKLKQRGPLPARIILCHLGSGASVMAIREGLSVDVSMGFSPLEGLVMGTRAGDLDPAAALYLERKAEMKPAEVERYLNTRCGLLGLSGTSADMRRLLELEGENDLQAGFAVEAFVYRVRKYIGAFSATLGGMDMLVFTAAIGERSPIIRTRICMALEWMGVHLDPGSNSELTSGDGFLHSQASNVEIMVCETGEMTEIAKLSKELQDG